MVSCEVRSASVFCHLYRDDTAAFAALARFSFADAVSCTIVHATFLRCAANSDETPGGTNERRSGDSLNRKPYHTSAPRYSPATFAWFASMLSFFSAFQR